MGSSKKKGQQRKAAKKALAAAAASGGGEDSTVDGGGSNSKIVAKIRSGDNKTTKKLFTAEGMASLSFISYEHSGVLSVVLQFLKRCESETFDGVMNSVGGDLKSPLLWIRVLVTASYVEPSCKLQIAQNIGSLISCMVNDTERRFFKSSKHWRQGIVRFFNLVMNIMETKEKDALENMQIVEALLQHEGLLRFIIQWIFWTEYRPDIVKELKSEDFLRSTIIRLSGRLIEMLVLSSGMKGEGGNWLLEIGSTPIVSKEYDPNFMLSYTAKMVNQLKETKEKKHKNVFKMVRRLIRDADCVDKGVITEMIDWGTNCVINYDDALKVGILFLDWIYQGAGNRYSNDTRVAFAIREGLIEMCLGFIKRFSEHESFENDDELPMHDVIRCILYGVNNISLHEKTAKAIRNKRSSIKEKLVRLEQDIIEGIEEKLLRNGKDNSLLQIESILNLNGSYCCRCNKSLSKTEVMQCNGCHRMVYCSRACQKEDWLNGHMLACCSTASNETAGTFQGRYWPERVPSDERAATKLKEIEINMNMIQLKLFLDRSDTIRRQAKDLNLPLYDCVVLFDLRECPPTVNIEEYTESFGVEDEIEGFEESRSKDNIMCVYHSRMYNRSSRDELSMQRFFPHEWLKKQGK